MNVNNVVLVGRISSEFQEYPVGDTKKVLFNLAVDKPLATQKKEELKADGKPTADFPQIQAWGKIAENLLQHKKKGDTLSIVGSLSTSVYEDKNSKFHFQMIVNVEKVSY